MRVQDIIWIQRDKTGIRLGDMTHTHLANAIRMVKRKIAKHEAEIDACYGYSGGDMAEMYAEQSANEASRKAHQGRDWLEALLAERERRKNLSTAEEAIEIMQEGVDA